MTHSWGVAAPAYDLPPARDPAPASGAPPVLDRAGTAVLIRRVRRRLRPRPGTDVLVLVRAGRRYVLGATAVHGPPGSPARMAVHAAVNRLLPPGRARPPPGGSGRGPAPPWRTGVLLVRCRQGRAVWLPEDGEWYAAVTAEAEWRRLRVGELVLLTQHGWRSHAPDGAGAQPRLAG